MGEDERTAIAETIVEIDRKMAHQSADEQNRMMRRRLALVEMLRRDAAGQRSSVDVRLDS